MSSAAPERIFAGLGLRLLSVGLLASMQALVKLAEARGAGLPETMFFRQACAVPLVLAWIAVRPGLASIRTQRIGAHLTRTIDRQSTRLNSSHSCASRMPSSA